MIQPEAAGVVLAGGKSTRMGRDKALVELNGTPLVAHAVDLLRRAGLPVLIAGAHSALAEFAPVVPDSEEDRGPLHGVCRALASIQSRFAVITPVDLPLLPASLIEYLLRSAQIGDRMVTLASVNGFAQTFPVVLRNDTLSALEREMKIGQGGCFRAFERAGCEGGQSLTPVAVENLVQARQIEHPQALPPARWFSNLNTPDDLARAQRWMASSRNLVTGA